MIDSRPTFPFRDEFSRLVTSVHRQLDVVSFLTAGFLFRSHIDDFVSGVSYLMEIIERLPHDQRTRLSQIADLNEFDPHFRPTLRRLCELSREAMFATDPATLPASLQCELTSLFRFVSKLLPVIADADAAKYVTNMGTRIHPADSSSLDNLAASSSR